MTLKSSVQVVFLLRVVNLWGMQEDFFPRLTTLDTVTEDFLAGQDIALKDLVQRDALEAETDDLPAHLQHSRKKT